MANTISNFLVGIGFDFDQKGAKDVDRAIDGVKSSALQLGAVLAGAFGIKSLTADFAAAYDEIGKFSQVFGLVPNDVTALGRALEHEGGNLQSLMGQLAELERMRAGLLQGDADFIARAGIAGIDTSAITSAKSATEAYIALADQFSRLNRQQRLNAAEALGLDEASIRLLSRGSEGVREMVAAEQVMRPVTDQMTDAARDFNDAKQNLFTNIGGFADNISVHIVPAITDVVNGMNEWIDANRELSNRNISDWSGRLAKNLDLVAIAGAGVSSAGIAATFASLASSVPVVGGAIGAVASGFAAIAAPVTAIAGAAVAWDWDADEFERRFGYRPPDWLFNPIVTVGGENGAVEFSNPFNTSSPSSVLPDGRTGFNTTIPPANGGRAVTIQTNIILDGKVIDRRIQDVTGQVYENTINDMKSSTGG